MRKFIMLTLVFSITSCSVKSQKNDTSIIGNWYSFDKQKEDKFGDIFINYRELYFDSKKVYETVDGIGLLKPKKYLLSSDSLFIFIKNKQKSDFVGIIDSLTSRYFSINKKGKINIYYKIMDKKTLEDFIRSNLSENNYYKEFNKRLNNQISRMEKK